MLVVTLPKLIYEMWIKLWSMGMFLVEYLYISINTVAPHVVCRSTCLSSPSTAL